MLCWKQWQWDAGSRRLVFILGVAVLLAGAWPATAGVPDWLRAAAREPLPDYAEDTEAVQLLDEQLTTVEKDGEIYTIVRRAYKILRPGGRDRGVVRVYYDSETRLKWLKAWALPAGQKEYELKEKDAVETSPFFGALYGDTRLKVLDIPAAEPGSVVGYEYRQRKRPFVLEDTWWFTDTIPVRRARYSLELPRGWEFDTYWLHHPEVGPQRRGGNTWVWEMKDIPAVEKEPAMPHWRAVAGRLVVTLFPGRRGVGAESHSSWEEVGRWYARLAEPRKQPTPAIREKVAELTGDAETLKEKIEALARFAQRDIRYVAIEIGIGGYQPHAARAIFDNRYGDCKDKATLLATMLGEIGVDSYYVLVHTRRGVVAPEAPSTFSFNHAILALRLPEEVPDSGLYAMSETERFGRLLFFDPTDELTPLGYLPANLQGDRGLLASEEGGELLTLPLLSPSVNRLLRTGKFVLTVGGDLTGRVQEIRWGAPATWHRAPLLQAQESERAKVLENYLVDFLGGFLLRQSTVKNLEEFDQNLVLHYSFVADGYAKTVGDLLLIRPRVLGDKGMDLLERDEERKYPVEFYSTSVQSDMIEITFPPEYEVDELPPPVAVATDFVEYHSQVEVESNVLKYTRNYIVKDVQVPTEELGELKAFFRRIAADEHNLAVLKRIDGGH